MKSYVRTYSFYSRLDLKKEKINTILTTSRLRAAKHFAEVKNLDLKSFLKIYAISR